MVRHNGIVIGLGLGLLLASGSWSPAEAALTAVQQEALVAQLQETAPEDLITEVTALAVNTPIWLSEHLPAMMPTGGIGAGLDTGEFFVLGVMPIRVGLFNQFSQVAEGTDLLGFKDKLPGNMVWPQFGVTAGIGIPGTGLGIGADVQMLPETNLGEEDLNVTVELVSIAASLRWQLNDPIGPLPSFVLGFGASYYTGSMLLGAGQSADYTVPLEPGTIPGVNEEAKVIGSYEIRAAPEMTWALVQLNPEVRLAWNLGLIRPYAGVGLGITYGEVRGGADLSATLRVDDLVIGDLAASDLGMDPIEISEDLKSFYKTPPARYTIRPHVGVDFVMLGFFAITAQLDVAVMKHDEIAIYADDVDQAEASFNTDELGGLLSNEAGGKSNLAAAAVGTVAVRLQF
jgi:hypothetical protein